MIEKELADLNHKIEVIYMDRLNNTIDIYNKILNLFDEQKKTIPKGTH